jgi:hypothetical protein
VVERLVPGDVVVCDGERMVVSVVRRKDQFKKDSFFGDLYDMVLLGRDPFLYRAVFGAFITFETRVT